MKRITDLYARFLGLFPEREFHYRAHGRVHYFRLTQKAQISAFLVVSAALLWSAFATFYFVTYDRVLRDKNAEIAEARMRTASPQNVAPAVGWNRTDPNAAAIGPAVKGVMRVFRDDANVARRREDLKLKRRLNAMTRSLAAKSELLAKLDAKTARRIEEIEKVIAMTGLDPDKLVRGLTKNGKGGPEETVVASTNPKDAFAVQAARLQARLDRWQKLQKVMASLPLIAPLDHYRKSSGFGTRRDPITGRMSRHNGLDFAYLINTPVLSTARGTVVFAGWRGGYGWMIEIDHGMGVRTRYGHLKKLLVTKGQKVGFRDKIGLLGTSGRSTGPHVHYEVIFDGRPLNPMKFITAGKYIFKS
jgi:murein DD-endopeptidase MepM/ murein hydrolase activator NlpD